jgi:hypothetical protein
VLGVVVAQWRNEFLPRLRRMAGLSLAVLSFRRGAGPAVVSHMIKQPRPPGAPLLILVARLATLWAGTDAALFLHLLLRIASYWRRARGGNMACGFMVCARWARA